MANQYLKPQIPLKDLNSEDYFYPLTTLDQIIIGNSRLSAYFSENNGKLIFNNIDEDSVGGSIKLDGITTNRTLFVENDSLLSSENIFINNDSLAINKTFITDGYKFEVNGVSGILDTIKHNHENDAAILQNYYNSNWYNLIRNHNNGNISISASSGGLYLGYENTNAIYASKVFRLQYDTPNLIIKDTNTVADTYAIIRFGNSSNDNGAYIFLNGPSRTADGGANTFMIRNNVGDVKIDDHLIVSGWTDHQEWMQINRSIYDQLLRFTSRGGYTSGWDSTQTIKYRSISSDYQGELYYFGPRWKDTYATAGNDSSSKTTVFQNTSYFQFREWSFNTNGTRTNFCEGYSLPNCDQARTAHAWYTIVTTKNPGALYWANIQCGTSANTGTQPTFNTCYTSNWFRSTGNTGWYSQSYGGGWYMIDTTWIRNYGSKAVYLNNQLRIDSNLNVGASSTAGNIICGTYKDTAHGEHQIQVNSGAGRWYLYSQASATGARGLYAHNNAGTGLAALYMNQDNYLRSGTRIYGAVWNDYAEFRKGQMDNLKPGQVVTEIGNGEMKLANKKLQKGCKILSDTYGFALGETKECKLPIAVAGRVLVYCDTAKEELEPGDCLCANYTGNTIKMTQEEIIKYPDRIVGIVSEIPNYNIWHSLDPDNPDVLKEDIQVDGRIWVYVR